MKILTETCGHWPAPLVVALAIVAALPACSGQATSGSSGDASIPVKYQAFAEAFDRERQQQGVPGASVALIEHGQLTFAHGFGTKGTDSQDPVDSGTLFRIGSMTKALTATALLGLVQSGAIDLNAPLVSIVPDITINDASNLSALTIRQLLSHQSGLYDYLVETGPTDDDALSRYLTSSDYSANEYFMDPPGTFYNYSNPDYYLAGLALERAGGGSYRQAVTTRVLAPLEMKRTFFLPAEVIADGNFSNGKTAASDGSPLVVGPDAYDNAWARPCGFAFSNVLDFTKFIQFLYAGKPSVLADNEHAEMQSPQAKMLNPGGVVANLQSYGFGLVIAREFLVGDNAYTTKLVWHNGSLPGFTSFFYLVPSTGFGIVWLANADNATFEASTALAFETFAGLTNPSTWPPPGLAVDSSIFPSYAGNYDDPNGLGAMTVTADGTTLSIDIPTLSAENTPYDHALRPTSMDNFTVNVQGAPIPLTFIADSTGAYVWLRTPLAVAKRVPNSGGATP